MAIQITPNISMPKTVFLPRYVSQLAIVLTQSGNPL